MNLLKMKITEGKMTIMRVSVKRQEKNSQDKQKMGVWQNWTQFSLGEPRKCFFSCLSFCTFSQNYPRGCSLSKRPQSQGQNRRASQTSSGSRSFSLASKTGMFGSSRTESLMSSIEIMSQRKKTSHLQQRLNSARRKSQNELVNRIGSMKIRIQVNKMYSPDS